MLSRAFRPGESSFTHTPEPEQMSFIKCLHCGQTALSIASQCPKCLIPIQKVEPEAPTIDGKILRMGLIGGASLLVVVALAASALVRKPTPMGQVRIVAATPAKAAPAPSSPILHT